MTDIKVNLNKKEEEKKTEKFQEYKSARVAVRMMTPEGIRITFTGHKFLTQNEAVIAYLDSEIKAGATHITKGEVLTTDDLDPMATLRREMKEEVRKEMEEEAKKKALGIVPNMGSTANKPTIQTSNSKDVAR